jgi:membrane protein YqaA with SNARE-associated domain
MLRRLYDWVLHWAATPYGIWALFLLSFAESSFFPIPPDVLLIALCVAMPGRSFKYALVCAVGSIFGGCLGYLIGWQFMASIGIRIVDFYGLTEKVAYIETLYNTYNAWAVGIAGFTPIPYKVFTIAAGMFKIDFTVFVLASAASPSARFFLFGGLIYHFGPRNQRFIEPNLDQLAVTITVLQVGSFVLIKYLF